MEDNKKIIEENTLIEIKQPDGTVKRRYPITKLGNVVGAKEAIENQCGALKVLSANPYIVDDVTKVVYKLGIESGNLYIIPVDKSEIEGIEGFLPDDVETNDE